MAKPVYEEVAKFAIACCDFIDEMPAEQRQRYTVQGCALGDKMWNAICKEQPTPDIHVVGFAAFTVLSSLLNVAEQTATAVAKQDKRNSIRGYDACGPAPTVVFKRSQYKKRAAKARAAKAGQ